MQWPKKYLNVIALDTKYQTKWHQHNQHQHNSLIIIQIIDAETLNYWKLMYTHSWAALTIQVCIHFQ